MSHEEATHCAICGRPLLGPIATSAGVDAECRARWSVPDEAQQTMRAAATHARRGRIVEVRRCADALRAAGFEQLGDAVASRFAEAEARAQIFVKRREDRIYFQVPFSRELKTQLIYALRGLPGREYEGNEINSIPAREKPALMRFLVRFFPGAFGRGDEGPFLIPEAT